MIYFPFELVNIYQQERIEEVEHWRLLKQIKAGESSLSTRLFSKIVYILVRLDRKLKKEIKQTLAMLTKVEVRFEDWLRNRLSH